MPSYVSPASEVGVEALNDEVRRQARAYMAMREDEFWEDARLRYPGMLSSELSRMESQINSGGTSDLSWLPYGEEVKARRPDGSSCKHL